jgi:hypothetical protein
MPAAVISRELAVELAKLMRRTNAVAEEAHMIESRLGELLDEHYAAGEALGEEFWRQFFAEVGEADDA